MKKLLLTLAGVGLVFSLASPANAVTISWSAFAYDLEARNVAGTTYRVSGGIAPGPPFFLDHSAIQFDYQSSGAPYHVSRVEYTAPGSATFVTSVDGTPQPVTFPSINPSNASAPPAAPVTFGGGGLGAFGNSIAQNFAFGEFAEGVNSSQFTYVRINDSSGLEIQGHAAGLAANGTGPYNGHDMAPFNGAMVHVTFERNPGANPGLPLFLDSTSALGVQNPPPAYGYGAGQDPFTFNFASTGGAVNVNLVPEPGSMAMLLALGVSGSVLALRRRR